MGQNSFRLTEMVVLLACGLLLLSIGCMNVVSNRANSRSNVCVNNLKQIGLAVHNYHSAFKQLPRGIGGTIESPDGTVTDGSLSNGGRLGPLVPLLPFMEQMPLWEEIANPLQSGGMVFPPMGPSPDYDPSAYTPWGSRPAAYDCPEDSATQTNTTAGSYVCNYGDAVQLVGYPVDSADQVVAQVCNVTHRGMFSNRKLRFRDTLDGLSNTMMFSEAKIGATVSQGVVGLESIPSLANGLASSSSGRTSCWADGTLSSSGFQGILPPNAQSATSSANAKEGIFSASSYHSNRVNVLMADGAVIRLNDSIDAGDSNSPTVGLSEDPQQRYTAPGSKSPYGVWGAIATRASKESIDQQLGN